MSETSEPRREQIDEQSAGDQPDQEMDALRSELDEANRKGEEYLQLLQRVQADFSNFRRRTQQQRQDLMNQAKGEVFLCLLPVLDDFDRALAAMPEEYKNTDWAQGTALIARKLTCAMEQEGLREINALGQQFDPWEHEAIDYVPSPNHKEGEIIDVTRKGYKIGDKVIRPAQVRVARAI